jgi:hypothetical protein
MAPHGWKKIIFFRVLVVSVMFIQYACNTPKRTAVANMVNDTKAHAAVESGQLSEISRLTSLKLDEEKIDTSVNNKIQNKLTAYWSLQDSAATAISRLEELLNNKRSFKNKYKKEFLPVSLFLHSFNQHFSARLYRYSMCIDGLSKAEKKLYELAAFFGPGRYSIPDEKKKEAYVLFSPLVDSIKNFSNTYTAIPQTASIVINGFADGTGFTTGSDLYQVLASALKKSAPEKAELNMQLSLFRAEAIAKSIITVVQMKSPEFISWEKFKIQSYEYGQGETLPSKTITNYTENDERRRIVLIYWCVLPDDQ